MPRWVSHSLHATSLSMLLCAIGVHATALPFTVNTLQYCTQLNGMRVTSTPQTMHWLDQKAKAQLAKGTPCARAEAAQTCWEGVYFAGLKQANLKYNASFSWANDTESVPWPLLWTTPEPGSQRGCASDCLSTRDCLPRDTTLLDTRLSLCTDDSRFSLTDAAGCFGRQLYVADVLSIELPRIDPASPVWGLDNVLRTLTPRLSVRLRWPLLDIRPLSMHAEFGSSGVIELAFMHASPYKRLFYAHTHTFHDGTPPKALRAALTEYLQEMGHGDTTRGTAPNGSELEYRAFVHTTQHTRTQLHEHRHPRPRALMLCAMLLPAIWLGYLGCTRLTQAPEKHVRAADADTTPPTHTTRAAENGSVTTHTHADENPTRACSG